LGQRSTRNGRSRAASRGYVVVRFEGERKRAEERGLIHYRQSGGGTWRNRGFAKAVWWEREHSKEGLWGERVGKNSVEMRVGRRAMHRYRNEETLSICALSAAKVKCCCEKEAKVWRASLQKGASLPERRVFHLLRSG